MIAAARRLGLLRLGGALVALLGAGLVTAAARKRQTA